MTDTDHQPFAMIIKIKCVATVRMMTGQIYWYIGP